MLSQGLKALSPCFHMRILRGIHKGGNNYWTVCEFELIYVANLSEDLNTVKIFAKVDFFFNKQGRLQK